MCFFFTDVTPDTIPEKEEVKSEKEAEEAAPSEEKKEEAPRRKPPVGGIGIMGGQMNMNIFSEMKSNKRFSTLVSTCICTCVPVSWTRIYCRLCI